MIRALLLIVLCQLLGEALVYLCGLPLSGPLVGMLALLLYLQSRGGPDEDVQKTGSALLQHLPLFFVPAAVGVMLYLDVLRAQWLAIAAALVGSTVLTLAATAWVMQKLARRGHKPSHGEAGAP